MNNNIKYKKTNMFLLLTMILICMLVFFIVPADVSASNTVSIDVRETDVRDVLSAVAVKMDVSIIYIEDPFDVTFKGEAESTLKLLELLLQSQSLTYIKDGNIMIVGKQYNLNDSYFDKMKLTRFNLIYIESDTIIQMIRNLNLQAEVLTIEVNTQSIWVQGTPQVLQKVKELITAVDRPENLDEKIPLDYREIQTELVKPERVVELLEQSGLILNKYITLGNRLLIFEEELFPMWNKVEKIVKDIDSLYAREKSIFVFQLKHTAAYYAKNKLNQLGFPNVISMELHYDDTTFWEDMSTSLLVTCPLQMESEVRNALINIDRPKGNIKTPIARGDSETRIKNLRDLLVDLSDVSRNNFSIFKFSNSEIVLWVNETPENIKLLQHLINSLKDGSLIFNPSW